MYQFGEHVTVSAVLIRKYQKIERGNYHLPGKVWSECTIPPRPAILIGYRTLSNGTREWESEVGYIYIPDNYFRAALVVFSDRENPVYVPLSGLSSYR